jgi:hypothetical protein
MDNIQKTGTQRKCAHGPCRCTVSATKEYCSDYCSRADDVEEAETQCGCGHKSCTAN